jgi:hypothetical protein
MNCPAPDCRICHDSENLLKQLIVLKSATEEALKIAPIPVFHINLIINPLLFLKPFMLVFKSQKGVSGAFTEPI